MIRKAPMNLLAKQLNLMIWLPALIACMILSSCRSLSTQTTKTKLAQAYTTAREAQRKFLPGLKDDKYILRLVMSNITKNPQRYYFQTRFYTREYVRNNYKKEGFADNQWEYRDFVSFHYLKTVSESPSGGTWFTFQICEYDLNESDLKIDERNRCWYPLLNRSRYPVPIEPSLIPLDNLTAADGTDLILGQLNALWRSEATDNTVYTEVESVWEIITKMKNFQEIFWDDDDYDAKITEVSPRVEYSIKLENPTITINAILETDISYTCRDSLDNLGSPWGAERPIVCNPTGK